MDHYTKNANPDRVCMCAACRLGNECPEMKFNKMCKLFNRIPHTQLERLFQLIGMREREREKRKDKNEVYNY